MNNRRRRKLKLLRMLHVESAHYRMMGPQETTLRRQLQQSLIAWDDRPEHYWREHQHKVRMVPVILHDKS